MRLRLILGFVVAAVLGAVSGVAEDAGAVVIPVPLAPAHEYVAIADRPVCRVLQGDANVVAADGAATVLFDGKVFWGFGDTYVGKSTGLPNVPNTLGYTAPPATDPAADCVTMQHKRSGANAIAMFAKAANECALWPLGMTGLQSPNVHSFYVSVQSCDPFVQYGIGLGTFDATTEPGFPSAKKGLVWPGNATLVEGAQPFTGIDTGQYLYIGIQGPPENSSGELFFSKTVRIARVPNSAAALEACVPESAPACEMEYWNASTQGWTSSIAGTGPAFTAIVGTSGGAMFGWNNMLQKWVSSYATGPLFVVRMRTSLTPTGPWASDETLLSYCPYFMLPGNGYCYTGYVHPEYDIYGGNTIYLTMATHNIPNNVIEEYAVFLHEITLGKPVVQSVNGSNARRYGFGGAPAGFAAEGTAFYASEAPIPGFSAIYEWRDPVSGSVLLGATQPNATHTEQGAFRFYAPMRQVVSNYANAYEPVYRWDRSATEHVYSPLTTLGAQGYTKVGVAFYTTCGDADQDYLSDCAEINIGQDPNNRNGNVDGDVLRDANGNVVTNVFGFPITLGNMQSVAQDDGVRRQDIDNCPLVANDYQENTDSGPIPTGAVSGDDRTRPNGDIFGDVCDVDRDNDGLLDTEEPSGCNGHGPTSTTAPDSDGDGIIDRYECLAGSDPSDGSSTPGVPAPADDPDGDGIATSIELVLRGNPNAVDTDGDRLNDAIEMRHWGTAPDVADTDGDGCSDAREAASVNDDWAVNSLDLVITAQRFGFVGYTPFDANRDGRVNVLDLQLMGSSFGACTPARHIDREFAQ